MAFQDLCISFCFCFFFSLALWDELQVDNSFSLKHSIWKLNEGCVANTAQGIQSGERVWFESALMGSDGWCGGY